MKKTILHMAALAILLAAAGGSQVSAQVVTWGTPTTISGDSDVINTGTLLQAAAFEYGTPVGPNDSGAPAGNVTVNGVTFDEFDAGNPTASPVTIQNGDIAISGNTSNDYNDGAFNTAAGSGNAPFSSLPSDLQLLLGGAVMTQNAGSTPLTLTLSGLTTGNEYEIELFVNDSSSSGIDQNETITGGGSTSSSISENNGSDIAGGVGQFITGTFSADATGTEVLNINDGGFHREFINAVEVTDLTAAPEPSTWALMLGGLGLLLGLQRFRRNNSRL